MRQWYQIHRGHAKKCCFCISYKCGVHLIGILLCIGMIYNLLELFDPAQRWYSLVYLFVTTNPALRYIQMIYHNQEKSKYNFLSAFKCMTYAVNLLLLIGGIIFVIV